MATNEVKLTIKIGDDGSLKVTTKKAKEASAAIEGVAASTKKAQAARSKYSKSEKGVAGATSNSTKAFSKMTTGIQGGLVPAYATLAANVFAVTAAFGVLKRSSALVQLEEGLIFTGRAAGQNLPLVVEGLKEITGAAISTADAMRTVAVGISAGFSQSQLEGLTRVAKGASLALGRDMTDALDRLTRGAAKLEPEILDELGIMVRLDEATEKYANRLGRTASELTQFERRMAFTNAIITQGEQKFAALSAVVDPNPYDKLAASFDNLTKTILGGLNEGVKPVINFLADNLGALIGLVGVFATGVVKQAVPALTRGGEAAAEFAAELADASKEQIAQAKSFEGAPKIFNQYAESVSNGTASQADMDKATKSLTKSINLHKSQMPGFIKIHGKASNAVKIKEQKLKSAESALYAITKAQALETQATIQATKADALNAVATGKFTTAITLAKTAIMSEWAATMLSIKSKGLLASSLAVVTTGYRTAAFSAKLFGLALLQAIPILGQIILIVSIAYSMLKDFFSTPTSVLDEALEKNKERFEEFPAVIEQMTAAIAAAETESAQFLAVLSPVTGILDQVTTAAKSLLDVQKQEQIKTQVAARMKLINANTKVVQSTKEVADAAKRAEEILNADTSEMSLFEKIFMGSGQASMIQGTLAAQVGVSKKATTALNEQADAQEAVNKATEELGTIDPLKTIEGVQEALVRGIATYQVSKIAVADNADAVKMLDTNIEGLEAILSQLSKGLLSPQGAVEAMQNLSDKQKSVEQSAKAAQEAVRGVTDIFAAAERPSGVFANQIEKLSTALETLKPGDDYTAIRELYSEIFEKYGVEDTASLKAVLDLMIEVNKETAQAALQRAYEVQNVERLRGLGLNTLATEREIEASKKRQALISKKIAAERVSPEVAAAETLKLIKEETAELKLQLKLIKEKGAAATRVGGDTVGAASVFGSATGATGGPETVAEGIAALNMESQATLENLKKLGPEGEVSAAIIGGALNVAEQWSSSLEIITSKGASTSDKLQAGFQAVGATINALSQIQKAQSQAAIAGVDREIKAEQKRDGKSKESIAKIAQLEKKKETLKKKAFEQDKKMKMAEVAMATGVAIMNAIASTPLPWGAVFATMAAAMGAAQLAAISSTSYQGGASSVDSGGSPSSITAGQRRSSVDLATSQSARGELAYFRGASGQGGPERFTPAFSGYKNRAEGGNTAYMVGEQGPELFVPERPGQIVPNDDIAASAPANVSFNINTIDASGVEDMLVAQRGNIIGMIRQAANSYGQDFVEDVDTSVFTQSAGGASRY